MTREDGHKIRLGNLNDIFEVADVFSNSVRNLCKNEYDPKTIGHWIDSKPPESRIDFVNNESLWVAELDSKIVGYLISQPGEILALFVAPAHSGSGVGSALGKFGIDIAKNADFHSVKLESTLTAVPFYKKLGFSEVGRGYYTHGITDLKLPIVNMVLS